MNEAIARKLLGKAIKPDGSLQEIEPSWIEWPIHDQKRIVIDGVFTVEYLEAVVWWMHNGARRRGVDRHDHVSPPEAEVLAKDTDNRTRFKSISGTCPELPNGLRDGLAGDHWVRIERILPHLLRIVPESSAAIRWLRRPAAPLGGARPLDLLASDDGEREVLAYIQGIGAGNFQ